MLNYRSIEYGTTTSRATQQRALGSYLANVKTTSDLSQWRSRPRFLNAIIRIAYSPVALFEAIGRGLLRVVTRP